MHVLNYLNTTGNSLETLQEDFAIKASISEGYPELFVLNYNQIDSPKNHDIVKECRSLVVTNVDGTWEVVSRAFDRFFNYGENDYQPDISSLSCFEKVDGSLVSVFFWKGEWLYRTKSMIMPVLSINGFDTTWKDLIEDALDWQNLPTDYMNTAKTYIFEVVGMENRVVVRYEARGAFLLAKRDNLTGEYSDVSQTSFKRPKGYSFKTTKDCLEAVKNLPNLEEGYVAYNDDGVPVCKIKSPAYVAAHRIKGEGLTPKRIRELVVINEQDEYLSVFPEDEKYFKDYIFAWNVGLKNSIDAVWAGCRSIESQKEFAINVKDYIFSGVLFQARKNATHPFVELTNQKDSYKVKLLEQFMEKSK